MTFEDFCWLNNLRFHLVVHGEIFLQFPSPLEEQQSLGHKNHCFHREHDSKLPTFFLGVETLAGPRVAQLHTMFWDRNLSVEAY